MSVCVCVRPRTIIHNFPAPSSWKPKTNRPAGVCLAGAGSAERKENGSPVVAAVVVVVVVFGCVTCDTPQRLRGRPFFLFFFIFNFF